MNTLIKLAASCLAGLAVAMCTASEYKVNRAPDNGAIYQNIKVGKTTRLDLDAALGEGRAQFSPGVLAKADGGVLYVDEVYLLPDHLVDLLLDVAA
ncbi:MAG: magnesium chelatase, partial [Janthinobacterium sp.]